MAMTCGICAGSNYYNQPLIYSIAEALKVNADQVALTIRLANCHMQLAFYIGSLRRLFEKRSYICLLMCCTGLHK